MVICHNQKFWIILWNDDSCTGTFTFLLGSSSEIVLNLLHTHIRNRNDGWHYIFHHTGYIWCDHTGCLRQWCITGNCTGRCSTGTFLRCSELQYFRSHIISSKECSTWYNSEHQCQSCYRNSLRHFFMLLFLFWCLSIITLSIIIKCRTVWCISFCLIWIIITILIIHDSYPLSLIFILYFFYGYIVIKDCDESVFIWLTNVESRHIMINFIICLPLFSLQIYKIHIIFRVFSASSWSLKISCISF